MMKLCAPVITLLPSLNVVILDANYVKILGKVVDNLVLLFLLLIGDFSVLFLDLNLSLKTII